MDLDVVRLTCVRHRSCVRNSDCNDSVSRTHVYYGVYKVSVGNFEATTRLLVLAAPLTQEFGATVLFLGDFIHCMVIDNFEEKIFKKSLEDSVTEPSTATEDLASEDLVGGGRGATFNLGFVVNNTITVYKSGGGPEEMAGKFLTLAMLYMTLLVFGYGKIVGMVEKVKKDFYEKSQSGLGLPAAAVSLAIAITSFMAYVR
ncbi:hypothetical protein Tco_0484392 [Tanacetum coccineum]